MENQTIIITYCIYLPIAIGLTLFVAKTLFAQAIVFMRDIFNGREEIAQSTNKLFEMGFYLLNIGFALWIMTITGHRYTSGMSIQESFEILSYKIGGFSIYLGITLFVNLYFFFRGKRKAKESKRTERVTLDQIVTAE